MTNTFILLLKLIKYVWGDYYGTITNKLRPNTLKDVLGQTHLIGKDKVLSNLIKNKVLFNIIFYGNSGCGKTTIALSLINDLNMRYRMLNATINSKKILKLL